VSGYGSAGPYAQKKAYDLLVQSEVGLTSITGTDDAPSKVGISVADIAAGMYAYSGILTALIARGASGTGSAIRVSLFDALAEWMGAPAYYTGYGGAAPARTGANHASIAPYGPFAGADGREVFLGVQNTREWARFCADVIQRPDLTDDERFRTNALRVRHREALHDAIDGAFRTLTADQILARLEAAQIANARMNTVAEFLAHPQLQARDVWRQIDSPAGPLRAMIPPAHNDDIEPVMKPVPALGEHRDAILRELGFDRDTIARWQQEGVV
jgi:itaconate CoA-transferase